MAGLPDFPLDDATLSMLEVAVDPWGHGHPEAVSSSLGAFLEFVSRLGGSDTSATVVTENVGPSQVQIVRDPRYSEGDVICALIAEVRRLRRG